MTMTLPIKSIGLAAAAAGPLLALVLVSPAGAADASSWDGDGRSAVRLVAGGSARPRADEFRAGLEIRLAPGWKTYWRYPGDSGVPPVIDFSKSENVKSVIVSWPAPHRFTDDGGTSIGYKDGVLMPLQVVPQNPARPVTLRAAVDYAICERICIPGQIHHQHRIIAGAQPVRRRIADCGSASAEARSVRPIRSLWDFGRAA